MDTVLLVAATILATAVGTVLAMRYIAWAPTARKRAKKRRVIRARKRATSRAAKAERKRLDSARATGKVVEVRRSGRRPVTVELSDGTKRYYFGGDLAAYKRGLESGGYPPRLTSLGAPPDTEA